MCSTFLVTLQARTLHGHHKSLDSKSLLHKLGIDNISSYKHIPSDTVPLASGDRLSPGGPDPQHNERKPPRPSK